MFATINAIKGDNSSSHSPKVRGSGLTLTTELLLFVATPSIWNLSICLYTTVPTIENKWQHTNIMASRKYSESSDNGDEAEDTISPLCTCRNPLSPHGEHDRDHQLPSSTRNKKNAWLEHSFVHLMKPTSPSRSKNTHDVFSPQHQLYQSPHGFLEEHQFNLQLLEAAHGGTVALCDDCIDIVCATLEKDTERLYAETKAYDDAAQAAQQRAKTYERHIHVATTEEAYRQEIIMLENELQGRQEELENLKALYKEQDQISKHLDALDDGLQLEQNSLELQSNAFDDRRDLMTNSLAEIQQEIDKLSLIAVPHALFDLQVDPRGLRYPLINQLRLAFQPKGDVPAEEVRVAWSQATQLLLFLGTLFDYPGTDWKLVPLADCAKLIYRKEIFNLSPGDCRSLMAWNALLDQVVRHAMKICKTTNGMTANDIGDRQDNPSTKGNNNNLQQQQASHSAPPFTSSPTTIGETELARLDPTDQFGWSQVIHRMASNLSWLSDRASELTATQVTSMAHCVV
jgi:hypothetical protein